MLLLCTPITHMNSFPGSSITHMNSFPCSAISHMNSFPCSSISHINSFPCSAISHMNRFPCSATAETHSCCSQTQQLLPWTTVITQHRYCRAEQLYAVGLSCCHERLFVPYAAPTVKSTCHCCYNPASYCYTPLLPAWTRLLCHAQYPAEWYCTIMSAGNINYIIQFRETELSSGQFDIAATRSRIWSERSGNAIIGHRHCHTNQML